MHGNRKFSCTKLASMSSLLKFETGRLTFQLGSFLHFYNLLQLVDNFSLYSFYSKRVFWVITKEITVDFQCHTNFAQFSIPKIHRNVSKLGKSQQLQNLILREVVCKLTCNSCGFTPTHSFILFLYFLCHIFLPCLSLFQSYVNHTSCFPFFHWMFKSFISCCYLKLLFAKTSHYNLW